MWVFPGFFDVSASVKLCQPGTNVMPEGLPKRGGDHGKPIPVP
jgi:hypothetical protein